MLWQQDQGIFYEFEPDENWALFMENVQGTGSNRHFCPEGYYFSYTGFVRMNRKEFIQGNVLRTVVWGVVWILAIFIFAESLNLAELWLSRTGWFFVAVLILGCILCFIRRLVIRKGKQFSRMIISFWQSGKAAVINSEQLLQWTRKHPRLTRFLRARLDTTAFSGLTLSILMLALVYVLALLLGIVEDLITSDAIAAADIHVANFFFMFRTHALTTVFIWMTWLGKSQVIVCFIVISIAMLWLWRKHSYILSLIIVVTGSEIFTNLGKLAFHRPRPQMPVYAVNTFSFPSGHATISVAFYGFAGYLLIRFIRDWNKRVNLFFLTIFIIIAIGFSRLYLGEHYLSDVLSGYLVGAMWLIMVISFSEWRGYQEKSVKSGSPVRGARTISSVLVSAALLFYVFFSIIYKPPFTSVPPNNTVVVSRSTDIFTNEQTKYTETMLGKKQEPVNFIFLAKGDNQLVGAMQQAGWVLTDKADIPSFIRALKAFISGIPDYTAPVSFSFWNTKSQDLSFAKVTGRKRSGNAYHVRIWRTGFLLENGDHIYIGIADADESLKWGIIPKIAPDLDSQREMLYSDLDRAGKIQSFYKAQLVKPLIGINFTGDQYFTDGKIYIIAVQK